jgi:dTDP-4-amino-4,6-dideoxygalactose transaminase
VFRELGHNNRLDSIQAAVLRIKLRHLDRWNQRRREIANRYKEKIKGTEYSFQAAVPGSESSYHIMAIRHPRRSLVLDMLTASGIGWGSHIVPPIHRQPGYRHLVREGERFPVSETLAEELISLPVYPELTDQQVDSVVDVLGKVEVSV